MFLRQHEFNPNSISGNELPHALRHCILRFAVVCPSMIRFQPIGYVRSPYSKTAEVPKGPGTQHRAEGILEIIPEFEEGLLDIEGFSHLFIIWVFDRSEGYELTGIPPTDDRPHGVFA